MLSKVKSLTLVVFLSVICSFSGMVHARNLNYSGNPILPGDFADPCMLQYRDTFYIYATVWDSKTSIVWYSADFRGWKMRHLNWPTTSMGATIWAPCVVKGKDGRFYMYSSTGSNIYAGVAQHPMGPFRNLLADNKPLVKNREYWQSMHSIDADCFIDNDGQAYLYWGSGFEFKNGLNAVARLNDDMCSFKELPKLITPPNYFEAPHMMKRNGVYYHMYSDGVCIADSYKVRYSTSNSPMGPFKEGQNSPILSNTPDSIAWSPGHHYTIHLGNKDYIIYHKQAIPIYSPFWGPVRQVCIDELKVGNGVIEKVKPTTKGIALDFVKRKTAYYLPLKITNATASSTMGKGYEATKAFDGSNGSLWAALKEDVPAWIEADLGKVQLINSCKPVFDIVDGNYQYKIEFSVDNRNWMLYYSGNNANVNEWPQTIKKKVSARYIRLTIESKSKEPKRVGLWELQIF